MTRRTDKVSAVLQITVGSYLARMELPALTTISKVEVTPDLKWCKIWITVMGEKKDQDKVMAALRERIYDLQGEVNRTLEMKIVPRLKFAIDHGEEYASHINELLRKAHQD